MTGLRGLRPYACLLAAGWIFGAGQASAAEPTPKPDLAAVDVTAPEGAVASFLARIAEGRESLKTAGLTLGSTYIGEVFGNLRGGLRRGAIYEGRLDLQLDADLGTLAGWDGLAFHASAYQIHGTGPSRYYVGSLAAVSGIEALPATRLNELWLEQGLLDKALTVRAGQLAADSEFFVSPSATLFVNATFGWPTIAASDLPSGGPATPLATPGIRAKWNPAEKTTVLLGVFNGDPAATARGQSTTVDPQRRDPTGTDFAIGTAPLVVIEAARAYTVDGPGPERTGTVKLGYFHHFGRFDDLHYDGFGLSLADPASTGIARHRRGADGVYAVLDQTLYREDDTSDRGAAAFLRVAASPSPTSLVDLYVDAGLVYKGLLPGRPDDVAGVSVAYTRIGKAARAYDRDAEYYLTTAIPIRRSEIVIETTYQAVLAQGFTLQPDLQYIVSPGGHTWNPRLAGYVRVKNSAVFGLRATIQY